MGEGLNLDQPVKNPHAFIVAPSSLLTTSSRAALRPNEQVSSVRQLMKEVKRSVGSAIKVLLGNMVIILEMIFEMPTASESSISILEG